MEPTRNPQKKRFIDRWPVISAGILLSGIFICFGVNELIAAYSATTPHGFLMLFFSSSFIILINTAIFLGLLIRCFSLLHSRGEQREQN
jgi:hypothetical protein